MHSGAKQLSKLVCEVCGSSISAVADSCSTCGKYLGAPNVRAAESPEERGALEIRYQKALEEAKANGHYDRLKDFNEKMKTTCAVINIDIDFLYYFVTNEKALYTTY